MQKIIWSSKGKNRPKIPMIRVENPEYYGRVKKHIDARLYYYKKYHPQEDTKGYVILHLDNDNTNFSEDNLVKVKQRVWNLLLNQRLWTNNKQINQTSILIATYQDESKTKRNKRGKENKQC